MIYDTIIIGSGSAGMTAGIYTGRALMNTLIIESDRPGGQAALTAEILNYPGVRNTTGPELSEIMKKQTEDFGCEYVRDTVLRVEDAGDTKKVFCEGGVYEAYSLILATGASHRKAGFEGEAEYTGRGVAYCATCDGKLFTGCDVYVIGGGFAAAEEGIFLTRFARSVTILIRKDHFRCAASVANKVMAHPKIQVKFHTVVEKVEGEAFIEKLTLKNTETNEITIVEAKDENPIGLFVFAGNVPQTEHFRGLVDMDEKGYVLADENMHTSREGIYAAGDIRPKQLRQLVTATADGAIAAMEAEKYVSGIREKLGLKPLGADQPVKQAPPVEEKKEATPKKAPDTSGKHFIKGPIEDQLRGLFGKLQRNLTIQLFLDQSPKAEELRVFMTEVASVSDHLTVKEVPSTDSLCRTYGIERFPAALLLLEDGTDTTLRFSGVPGGHELTSLALAIYRAGTESGLKENEKAELQKLQKPMNLKIAISLTCHLCPDVVASCMQLALESPLVTAEMIDVSCFPDLQKEYKIMSVPCIIINDGQKLLFGSKKTLEILAELQKL